MCRLEVRRKKPTAEISMVDTLVISIRQSHIISQNKQKYISQTYDNSNFDRLKNSVKTLKEISALKISRIFSLNRKIVVIFVFSEKKKYK